MQKLTVTQLRHVTSVNASSITFYSLSDAAVHAMFTKQEAQLMLTTGSTRLAVSRGRNGTIPHVTYSFLLRNSNFVFYDIRLQKIS